MTPGWKSDAGTTAPSSTGPLPADTADALQQALAAEHAAIWSCGLASAFVSNAVATETNAAMTQHQARRDMIMGRLVGAGLTPVPAEPAYVPPRSVDNQTSAVALLAIAESDVAVAWRAVLERTDDADLRTTAVNALTDSAVRQTRWRRASGQAPASVAMPGQPDSTG